MNLQIERVDILSANEANEIQSLINNRIDHYKKNGNKYIVNNVQVSTAFKPYSMQQQMVYTAILSLVENLQD